ncbi:MAG: glycosyltransferase family 39 protein [Anaerolineae bacterium]|nr:glycosyltransferase family 39 protein [Anaerolineae bacterium]
MGLLVVALAVRLPNLGKFLTPDEFLWVDRSRNFLAGLLDPHFACKSEVLHTGFEQAQGLACTLRTGHPGVTTMWSGSLGILLRYLADRTPDSLLDYTLSLPTNPLDARLIVPERLPSVLFLSLAIMLIAWLVGKLFHNYRVGLVAGLLMALDPFHAALSRVIHHDALAATFMSLAVLTALLYWIHHGSRHWLIASGVCGGLAFLSKSSTLFLAPFVLLLALWSLLAKIIYNQSLCGRHLLRVSIDASVWLIAAVATFCVCWPAMWVIPTDAVRTIFAVGMKYASEGHAKGNYFFGTISNDPGVLFYPFTWLLRSSPLAWIGLFTLLWTALRHWTRGSRVEENNADASCASLRNRILHWLERAGLVSTRVRSGDAAVLWLLCLYVMLFTIFMTFGEKKQDRYLLPVYPILSTMAAVGLSRLAIGSLGKLAHHPVIAHTVFPLLLAVILIFQGFLIVVHHPYYFTYYNPLLGGIRGAQSMVTIGWGEGLDLAADYLNRKPNAEQLRVATWYHSTFAPFFKGEAVGYSKEKGKALSGNYVLFYINQLQRRFPDEELFRYFEQRYQPEAIISLHGIPYVVIYPGPGMQHYVEDRVNEHRRSYRGIAALLGWDWLDVADPDRPSVAAGNGLRFRLYWEYLGKRPEERFFFRLLDVEGRRVVEALSQPLLNENGDPSTWRRGQIIVEEGVLTVPADTAPGEYRLQIGFYTQAPAVTEGELVFDLPELDAHVCVTAPVQLRKG